DALPIFYIFRDGRLWREIQIRSENGQTTYHDVRLAKFRGKENTFTQDEREAEGKGLREIWLPAHLNWRTVTGLEVAYAEDQWPAARLNRLEQDASLRKLRCDELEFDQNRIFKKRVDRIDDFKPHRPRDAAFEWRFDQPQQYLTDLSGQYSAKSYDL